MIFRFVSFEELPTWANSTGTSINKGECNGAGTQYNQNFNFFLLNTTFSEKIKHKATYLIVKTSYFFMNLTFLNLFCICSKWGNWPVCCPKTLFK